MPEETNVATFESLAQKQAELAWNYAKRANAELEKNYDRYVRLVKNLPAYIRTNGLGPTLAMLWAKRGRRGDRTNAHERLFRDLEAYLDAVGIYHRAGDDSTVLDLVTQRNTNSYIRATTSVDQFLVWLKPFAESWNTEESDGTD